MMNRSRLQIEVAALKGRGEEITKEREEEILGKIRSKYEESMSPLLRGGTAVAGCHHRSAGYAHVDQPWY
jgi:hypothetical protein